MYDIVDCNGFSLPLHYSDRYRTKKEADKLVESLNKHGEHTPYKAVEMKFN